MLDLLKRSVPVPWTGVLYVFRNKFWQEDQSALNITQFDINQAKEAVAKIKGLAHPEPPKPITETEVLKLVGLVRDEELAEKQRKEQEKKNEMASWQPFRVLYGRGNGPF